MQCANCGRQNQPTTRFCAECGDVLRADSPRTRRSRSKKSRRRAHARIHWVRVSPRPAPTILTAAMQPSPASVEAGRAPERMMRRIDLVFAALVGVAGIAAYVAYPYLKGSGSAETAVEPATVAAPTELAHTPMPSIETRAVSAPQPQAPPSALPSLAESRTLDVVPPRASPPRAKPDVVARRPAERPASTSQHPRYSVTTSFADAFGTSPPSAPTRVAAAPSRAPARTDRLQQMNDMIAGCASEGFFGRVACEQRALLTYCDGQWGKNERCPSGRTVDYGN